MSTIATFEQLGLRAEKAIARHLLLENAYDSNLLPDISTVDYLAGHAGPTKLLPLDGLPTFVDDMYVFGYMHSTEGVYSRGNFSCTLAEGGSAKRIVHNIACAV